MTSTSGDGPIVVVPLAPALLDMSSGPCLATVPEPGWAAIAPALLDMSSGPCPETVP